MKIIGRKITTSQLRKIAFQREPRSGTREKVRPPSSDWRQALDTDSAEEMGGPKGDFPGQYLSYPPNMRV
jgi:hypothetical protein